MASVNEGNDRQVHDLRGDLGSFSIHDVRAERLLASSVWVTPLLIALNVLAFAAMAIIFQTFRGFTPPQLAAWGGNSAPLDLSGQWWRLLSYQFLHVNLLHIAVNMWVMWNVGRLTERLYGSIVLLFLYLTAGVLAGLASIVWNPELVSVGASGSIFGVLGAFLAYVFRFRNEAPSSVLRYWFPAIVFAAYNLFAGAIEPGVDNAAHVGGVLAGLSLGAIVGREPSLRTRFPALRFSAAAIFAAACALLPLWYLDAFDHRPSPLEAFTNAHRWYMDSQASNLRLWQSLAEQMQSGTLSNDEAGREFEQDVVPFWKSATVRLDGELKRPHHENTILPVAAEFARMRLNWAEAIVVFTRDSSPQRAQQVLALSQQTARVQAAINLLQLRSEVEEVPTPLSQLPVVAWAKSLVPKLRQGCVAPPAFMHKPLSALDSAADGPAQRHGIACRAQQMFMAGDYRALDGTIKQYSRRLSDLPDGSSRLEGVWDGLDDLFEYGGITVEDVLHRTSTWRKVVNGSVEPDLAEAMMFRDWAYTARGHGFASSVSPQAMQIFLARSQMAAVELQEVERSAASDPTWYALTLGVDRDESVPVNTQISLFVRGAKRFPDYTPIYRQMLMTLMPRWDGSYAAVEFFIRQASTRNGKLDAATYARLYLIYANLEGNDFSLIESANPDPELLKQGMEALVQRYPKSDYILNSVARAGCASHEYQFYRSVSPLLRGRPSPAAWPDKLTVASCEKWSS